VRSDSHNPATYRHDYDARPHYPPVGGKVLFGWDAAVDTLPARSLTLAVDGPEMLDWREVVPRLTHALRTAGHAVEVRDTHSWFRPWSEIDAVTASPLLEDDPEFATLTSAVMADLLELPEAERPDSGVLLVHGPGAALAQHDVLWFADVPKRHAEAAVNAGHGRHLGQPEGLGPATTRRLFYIDWPIQDRHRDAVARGIDRWVDAQDPAAPVSMDGATLRASLAAMAQHPFRVQPTSMTVSWGGHWVQRSLGMSPGARNSGITYELIAPENGVLIGEDGRLAEVPFQLLVALNPEAVLGADVHAGFGTSFPIRFDYLDTVDGGNLSVHCHPLPEYMRHTFGFPYTQHEAYYVMVSSEGSRIFLGLRDDADLQRFQRQAHNARVHEAEFDISQYIQSHPATQHQLYVIPAGTPHGSGKGNVVLEVSATPYLYSLRFYDWLRRDEDGRLRPVHVNHAFANLQRDHVGPGVLDDLIRSPQTLREDGAWREEILSFLPEVFYEVRRFVLESPTVVDDDTAGRFHVLNVVEGSGLELRTQDGYVHDLAYAETIVIPAAVGRYEIRTASSERVLVVKALVR
jgi:mannose-6-phosphate isomerase class I